MGKKSRSKAASCGSSTAAASGAAPASAATARAASSAAAASALDFLGSEADITVRLGELLDSIRCRNVLQRLRAAGYSDQVGVQGICCCLATRNRAHWLPAGDRWAVGRVFLQ